MSGSAGVVDRAPEAIKDTGVLVRSGDPAEIPIHLLRVCRSEIGHGVEAQSAEIAGQAPPDRGNRFEIVSESGRRHSFLARPGMGSESDPDHNIPRVAPCLD